jgi:Ca2+ transporting ATPase
MIIVLLISAVIGFVFAFLKEDPEERTTPFIEPFVIITILILNATITLVKDLKAQKSVADLKQFQPDKCHAKRDGSLIEVSVGQQVPADCRLIQLLSTNLEIFESSLTGESAPATKTLKPVAAD